MILTGNAEIWHLAALQVVRGIASSFFFPASTGIVPQTVSAPLLQQANALLRLTTNAALVIGTAAGGVVVATCRLGLGDRVRRRHLLPERRDSPR